MRRDSIECLRAVLCSGWSRRYPYPLTGRRRKISSAIAGLVLLLGMGCQRSAGGSPGFTVKQEITPQPARVGRSSLTFTITDAAGRPERSQLAVGARMSHAGMKPEFADVKETQPGRYEAEVALPMAGDWVILLHGKLQNGAGGGKTIRCKGCATRRGPAVESNIHPWPYMVSPNRT